MSEITITLTSEQAEDIKKLRDASIDWANKTLFLSEVADQQFETRYEFDPSSWVGLGAILKDLSESICERYQFLWKITDQFPKENKKPGEMSNRAEVEACTET